MSQLSIRWKIWLSFLVLVALLIAVGVIANSSLKANKEKLSTLVNDVQPAVVLSLNLVDELDHASASLGFYLLSKEETAVECHMSVRQRPQNLESYACASKSAYSHLCWAQATQ